MPLGKAGAQIGGGPALSGPPLPGRLGVHWIIDAQGCPAAALRDEARLRGLLGRLVHDLELNPLGEPVVHRFPDEGGVTAFLLLSESHVALHTFPEHGAAALDVYCCRVRPEIDWGSVLREGLGASDVDVRALPRGGRR